MKKGSVLVFFISFFVIAASLAQPVQTEAAVYCDFDDACMYYDDEPVASYSYGDSSVYYNQTGGQNTSSYDVVCDEYEDDGIVCNHYTYEKEVVQQTGSPITVSFPTYTYSQPQTYSYPVYYPVTTPVYVPTPVTKTVQVPVTNNVYVPQTKVVTKNVYVPVKTNTTQRTNTASSRGSATGGVQKKKNTHPAFTVTRVRGYN